MPRKRTKKQTSIKVGNISNISGQVNIAGGDITTRQSTVGSEENNIGESRMAGDFTSDAPPPEGKKKKKRKGK